MRNIPINHINGICPSWKLGTIWFYRVILLSWFNNLEFQCKGIA